MPKGNNIHYKYIIEDLVNNSIISNTYSIAVPAF